MSITGVTWLTGEYVDATRLNYIVDNTAYIQTLFTTGTPWVDTNWANAGFVDVDTWADGQVIDSVRMNQMFANQNIMNEIVGSGLTIMNDTATYDDVPYHGDFFIVINGVQKGTPVRSSLVPYEWTKRVVSNIDLSEYEDYSILDITFKWKYWLNGEVIVPTYFGVKAIKYPQTNYISFDVELSMLEDYPNYRFGRKNLNVLIHDDYTIW